MSGQRGSGTVLTAVVLMAILVVGWAGVVAAGWMGQVRHARQAADLAALAGAQARVASRDACGAARRVARDNDAQLTRCTVRGDLRDVVVEVEVKSRLRPHVAVAGAPRWAVGRATAASMPR